MSKEHNEKREKYLQEAAGFHQRFTQSLVVKKIDVASVSTTAKTPFKALVLSCTVYFH